MEHGKLKVSQSFGNISTGTLRVTEFGNAFQLFHPTTPSLPTHRPARDILVHESTRNLWSSSVLKDVTPMFAETLENIQYSAQRILRSRIRKTLCVYFEALLLYIPSGPCMSRWCPFTIYPATLSVSGFVGRWLVDGWIMNWEKFLRKWPCLNWGTVPAFALGIEWNYVELQSGWQVSRPIFERNTSRIQVWKVTTTLACLIYSFVRPPCCRKLGTTTLVWSLVEWSP
jgi:hypothetical protein